MKHFFTALFLLLVAQVAHAVNDSIIRISTRHLDLVLQVAENARLYQTYLGDKLLHEEDLSRLKW